MDSLRLPQGIPRGAVNGPQIYRQRAPLPILAEEQLSPSSEPRTHLRAQGALFPAMRHVMMRQCLHCYARAAEQFRSKNVVEEQTSDAA